MQFATAVRDVAASKVSTRAFAEDGYAGLVEAIQGIDWTGFGGRYLIMITDASSREGNSPLASTGLGTEQVRQLALENGIATYVLYLKTPAGKDEHAIATKQYQALTKYPNVGSLFFPVEAGDKQAFRTQVKRLAEALVNQVSWQDRRTRAAWSASSPAPNDRLTQVTEAVGHAMQLAYLGQLQGTKAPRMFEAWASDHDFRQPDIASFSVRLLLTKNQLQRFAGDCARSSTGREGTARPRRLLQPVAQHRSRDEPRSRSCRPGQRAQPGRYRALMSVMSRLRQTDPSCFCR